MPPISNKMTDRCIEYKEYDKRQSAYAKTATLRKNFKDGDRSRGSLKHLF